jgi:hypothetical protein
VSSPARETKTVGLNQVDSPRWIDDTLIYVFAETNGAGAGQLKLMDTHTGKLKQITNDAGTKSFAYGWKAPEFGGQILALALADYKSVVVWRDMGGEFWERIATLTPPPAAKYGNFGSPEPFIAEGRSFISLVLKSQLSQGFNRDSEVWIFGIDSGLDRFARRVDDGGDPRMRSDPETYAGADELYVYYNVFRPGQGAQIHRARTGLKP